MITLLILAAFVTGLFWQDSVPPTCSFRAAVKVRSTWRRFYLKKTHLSLGSRWSTPSARPLGWYTKPNWEMCWRQALAWRKSSSVGTSRHCLARRQYLANCWEPQVRRWPHTPESRNIVQTEWPCRVKKKNRQELYRWISTLPRWDCGNTIGVRRFYTWLTGWWYRVMQP